jgi:pyruvate/2-oxoglutarate dehydrogenase complex dihydrolipoamide dehydrogenase (E3) component
MVTNETIFTMPELPKRLLIVGAGPIGIEMAQAFCQLGVQVTVLDPGSEILGKEDRELAGELRRQLAAQGVTFLLEHTLASFRSANEACAAYQDTEVSITFDTVLASIGRVVDITPLSPDRAGITVDERGVPVLNQYLQTTNRHVFVCGDAAGQHQFTHAAELHAAVVIRNLLVPLFKKPLNTDGMAWVTYTYPELATFGRSEAALRAQGVPHEVLAVNLAHDDRSITANAAGVAKLFVDTRKRILGGTLLAPRAGELIAELLLAQQHGLTTTDLFNKVYPYPTFSRINKQLATIPARKQLTSRSKAFLRFLFRL